MTILLVLCVLAWAWLFLRAALHDKVDLSPTGANGVSPPRPAQGLERRLDQTTGSLSTPAVLGSRPTASSSPHQS